MRVVIQASGLLADSPADTGHVYWDFLYALCSQRSADQFVLVFDRPFSNKFPFPANVMVVEKPVGGSSVSAWWWRSQTWPGLLKKYRPDLVLVVDNVLPVKQGIPAFLLLAHAAGLLKAKETSKHIGQYSGIITMSAWMKGQVLELYPAFEGKVYTFLPGNLAAIRPVEWEEREEFKRELTNGVEYFAAVGTFHQDNNILPLLKAFSKLKGRLHSNIKLVIAGRQGAGAQELADSLATYRYRDDVIWVKDASIHRLSRLIASSYALVHVATREGVAIPVLAAQRAQVPVVALHGGAGFEAGGEAALYAVADDVTGLAEQMGALYKDEQLRNRLLASIPVVAEEASWERFAASVWQVMTH